MIGLQKLIIDQNIKVSQLARELEINPERIWNWIKNNRIPKKSLGMLANKFSVEEDYLNTQVNDICTFEPRIKGFNNYIIDGDIMYVILRQRNAKKEKISIIDTE